MRGSLLCWCWRLSYSLPSPPNLYLKGTDVIGGKQLITLPETLHWGNGVAVMEMSWDCDVLGPADGNNKTESGKSYSRRSSLINYVQMCMFLPRFQRHRDTGNK
jgi:hypothetical protein